MSRGLSSRIVLASANIITGLKSAKKHFIAVGHAAAPIGPNGTLGAGRVVIDQKIGQSDLAAMAGIARESLSRILTDWQRRKLVSRLSGYYCIEDKAQLQEEAEL